MWWQYLLGFFGLVLIIFGNLTAFWLGGKVAKGELRILPKKPPSPVYHDPKTANKIREEARKRAQEAQVKFEEYL